MSRIAVNRNTPVAVITVGDGRRSNSLGECDWHRLTAEIRALSECAEIRAIVITGRDQMFSAGSDMTEWRDADQTAVEHAFEIMEGCFRTIEEVGVPVIAAVEGTAAGAGCQLALACDLTVASTTARIGMPIVRLGILASVPFVQRLTCRVGAAVAGDLFLTGRLLGAAEAQRVGLVARMAPPGTTFAVAHEIACTFQCQSAAAVTAAKFATRDAVRISTSEVAPTIDPETFHVEVRSFLSGARAGDGVSGAKLDRDCAAVTGASSDESS